MADDEPPLGPVAGVRFLVELATLVSLGVWGYLRPAGIPASLALALGLPLLAAVIWGILVAPDSPVRLETPLRQGLEVALFGAGVLALVDLGWPLLAGVLGGLAALAIVGTARHESTGPADAGE